MPGETEEVFINRFKTYINRVSKDFQIDFVKPDIKMSVFPSPFTEDFLNAVVISEGQVSMKLHRPDGSEESLSLTKVKNTQDRLTSVFKAEEIGVYTSEVNVVYEDGLSSIKKYVFEVHDFLDGKNIIPSSRDAALVMRKATDNMRFLFTKDQEVFTIDSLNKGEFTFEHSMQFIEKRALFRIYNDEFTLVEGKEKNGFLITEIKQSGNYAVVKDTSRPQIDISLKDEEILNIIVSDISLKEIEISDQKKIFYIKEMTKR